MKRRPLSISIIAWLIVALAVFGFLGSIPIIFTPRIKELIAQAPIQTALEIIYIYGVVIIHLVVGIALLKGRNWGRFLYIFLEITRFAVNLAVFKTKLKIIPMVIFFAVITFFLFRPKANDYFAGRAAETRPERKVLAIPQKPEKLWRKITIIIFYIISALFLCLTCLLSFWNDPRFLFKAALLGGFFSAAVLFSVIALWLTRFSNWQRPIGIVVLGAAGYMFSVFLSIAYFMAVPEYSKALPPNFPFAFNNYVSGSMYVGILGIIGLLLIINSKKKIEPCQKSDHNSHSMTG